MEVPENYSGTSNIKHWVADMAITKELAPLCKEEPNLWPALLLIRCIDKPNDKISKIMGENIIKNPKITFGEDFINDCRKWILTGSTPPRKYNKYKSEIQDESFTEEILLVLKYISLLLTGQEISTDASIVINSKDNYKIKKQDINFDSKFAKSINQLHASKLIKEFYLLILN